MAAHFATKRPYRRSRKFAARVMKTHRRSRATELGAPSGLPLFLQRAPQPTAEAPLEQEDELESLTQTAAVQPKLQVGQVGDVYEQEADRMAEAVTSEAQTPAQPLVSAQPTLQRTATSAKATPGSQSLERRLTTQAGSGSALPPAIQAELSPHFNADLDSVRVHTDTPAAEMNRNLHAQAFTHQQDIYFASGRYDPHSLPGRRLLAHEVTHVVQQSQGKGLPLQRKSLADAPKKQQQALSLPSSNVSISTDVLKEYFEKLTNGKWGASKPAPSGVAVELSGISADYLTPMTSLAMYMHDQMSYASPVTGETKYIFGPGLTVTVHLPLATYGLADGNYRFAWVGTGKAGTIYIEAMTTGPKQENTPTEAGGTITIGTLTFEAVGSWPASELDALKRSLALIPLKALDRVNGLKFERQSGQGSGGEDGKYEEDRHTVVLFDSLFDPSDARFGESTKAVQEITHEIAHAIDLMPLSKAWKTYESTGKESKLKGAQSESGSTWQQDASGTWQMAERIDKTKAGFRKAATKDGVKVTTSTIATDTGTETLTHLKGGLSEYSNKDWTELYAESFALYVTDPATLKLLRPNIYAYFAKQFPRTAK